MQDKAYEEICSSFRQLTDVRFKLLALVPAVSGTAIALMSKDLALFAESPLPRTIIALLGFLVTLGLVFYDQRNSQLYNALVKQGRKLEEERHIAGPFSQRQPRTLKFLGLFTIWHDRGLALIYGTVLGAWMFPLSCGVFWMLKKLDMLTTLPVTTIGTLAALVTGVIFILELHRLDRNA